MIRIRKSKADLLILLSNCSAQDFALAAKSVRLCGLIQESRSLRKANFKMGLLQSPA